MKEKMGLRHKADEAAISNKQQCHRHQLPELIMVRMSYSAVVEKRWTLSHTDEQHISMMMMVVLATKTLHGQ